MYASGFPAVCNCQNNFRDVFPLQLNLEQAHLVSAGGVGDGVDAAALAPQLPPSLCGASTEHWTGSLAARSQFVSCRGRTASVCRRGHFCSAQPRRSGLTGHRSQCPDARRGEGGVTGTELTGSRFIGRCRASLMGREVRPTPAWDCLTDRALKPHSEGALRPKPG